MVFQVANLSKDKFVVLSYTISSCVFVNGIVKFLGWHIETVDDLAMGHRKTYNKAKKTLILSC